MKCSNAKFISLYADNELNAGEKIRFEAHMQSCLECSRKLELIQKTSALFKQAQQFQAPYGFSRRVMARATEPVPEKSFFFPLFARFSSVAIMAIVVLIGVVSGRFIMSPLMNQPTGSIASTFSLDVFEPAPPDSLGGIYLAMTEANNEK